MTMVVVGGRQSAPPSSRNSQVRGHHFQGSVPDQFTQHRLFRHRLQDKRKNFGRCPKRLGENWWPPAQRSRPGYPPKFTVADHTDRLHCVGDVARGSCDRERA